MDPVHKLWMYENWMEDRKQQAELAKSHAYLLASFWNPEAVQNILGGETYETTDEEFEASSRMVKEESMKLQEQLKTVKKRKRKRYKLKGQ